MHDLQKLGYVEKYRKGKRSWYLSRRIQWCYLIQREDIVVSCRKEDREYFMLGEIVDEEKIVR